MSFVDVVYEESDKFQRTDLTPYREVFDNLKPGIQATIVVPTGDWITKTNEDGSVEVTNRGKIEKGHERGFRGVATERGVGLRVGHNHMPDGKTRLRLMVDKKREFTPEALKKRTDALAKGREDKAVASLMATNPDLTAENARKQYRSDQAQKKAAEKQAAAQK